MYQKVQVEQDFEFYVKESEIYSSRNFSPLNVLGIGASCAKLLLLSDFLRPHQL